MFDRAAHRGDLGLPGWVDSGSADAARQVLTALAAAIITGVGLVFSITIVALTLASTQLGPRMLRIFLRDRGTQVSLGAFVATFVYVVLALGSIEQGTGGGSRSTRPGSTSRTARSSPSWIGTTTHMSRGYTSEGMSSGIPISARGASAGGASRASTTALNLRRSMPRTPAPLLARAATARIDPVTGQAMSTE